MKIHYSRENSSFPLSTQDANPGFFPPDLQVGKGLSKDEKAQKLALRHWLEAVSNIIKISNLFISFWVIQNHDILFSPISADRPASPIWA